MNRLAPRQCHSVFVASSSPASDRRQIEKMMEIESFKEEKAQLAKAVKVLDLEIISLQQQLGRGKDTSPVFGEAARTWRKSAETRLEDLTMARPTPYFGRVDVAIADGDITCYIGKRFIKGVSQSMHAPIAAVYYRPTDTGYRTATGMVQAKVKLRRDILVSDGQLVRVSDTYVYGPVPVAPARRDLRLSEALGSSRQGHLPDISDTIQPEQYKQIAEDPDCVLVVQGVAGSGKSEIGLHRLAYLLSPHNDRGLNLTSEQVVYIGPSRAFLLYIENLLPDLALERVRHLTLRDWLLATLPEPVRIEQRDMLMEAQLSGRRRSLAKDTAAATFKLSLSMHKLIDKYVKRQRTSFIEQAREMRLDGAVMTASQVSRTLRKIPRRPLNQSRAQALRTVETHMSKALGRVLSAAERQTLCADLDRFWPEIDFREAHRRLLSDGQELISLLSGLVPVETSGEMVASLRPRAKSAFGTEDLPGLSYMGWAVGPRENRRKIRRKKPALYSHIVVDEAQDISPLELLLIRNSSRNRSVTILGDLNQRLLPHRGIGSWQELSAVFGKSRVRRHHVQTSYRATFEITSLANTILRRLRPKHDVPRPYHRSGDDPSFVRSESGAEMNAAVARDVEQLLARGMKTVAVLCKTSKEAGRLSQALLEVAAIRGALSRSDRDADNPRVIVSSIFDVKGMEFDAVIIANAGRRNYTASDVHRRLLYLAITRAAHSVSVHSVGRLAEAFSQHQRATRVAPPARRSLPHASID